MKRFAAVALFLAAGFTLAAQTRAGDFSVYVPPVSGNGAEADANSFFAGQLSRCLVDMNYSLTGNRNTADFTLWGTLSPLPEGAPEQDAPEGSSLGEAERLFSFHLLLSDNNSGAAVAEQTLFFSGSGREELSALLSVMVSNIFSGVSPAPGANNDWRDKTWYFGAAVLWAPRIYSAESQAAAIVNFGGGLRAEFRVFDFLALETGVEAAPDWIAVSPKGGDTYWDAVLEIPLSLKLVLKPGSAFTLEPYGGVHLNIPMYGATKPPLFSWRLGLQYNIEAGPGVFFLDPRFSMDFGKSALTTRAGQTIEYQRYTINLGIGYKFGL